MVPRSDSHPPRHWGLHEEIYAKGDTLVHYCLWNRSSGISRNKCLLFLKTHWTISDKIWYLYFMIHQFTRILYLACVRLSWRRLWPANLNFLVNRKRGFFLISFNLWTNRIRYVIQVSTYWLNEKKPWHVVYRLSVITFCCRGRNILENTAAADALAPRVVSGPFY